MLHSFTLYISTHSSTLLTTLFIYDNYNYIIRLYVIVRGVCRSVFVHEMAF